MSRTHLLFMHNILDLAQNLKAQRQPRINPGRRLLDHPSAQHKTMRDNLRFRRGFFQNGQEVAAQTHGEKPYVLFAPV